MVRLRWPSPSPMKMARVRYAELLPPGLSGRLAIPAKSDALAAGMSLPTMETLNDAEEARLNEARTHHVPWKTWGPYVSERQWGTVREDYSASGDAWNYFSHDQARSRAYRWGEDGLAGISDDNQLLCF